MYNELFITPVPILAKYKLQISGELFGTHDDAARRSTQLQFELNSSDPNDPSTHQLTLRSLTAWQQLYKLRYPEAQPE